MPDLTIWLFHRFASGTLGPVTFGLGLRDSCLVILFFNLLCAVPRHTLRPGAQTGFSYYGAMVPSFLSITAGILGGQALSSVANLSWTCVVLRATNMNLTDLLALGL
ncbi:hypothetical protein BJV77DRAFT_1043066 [Russula vinacea]|nr:hypothetical protein BJV77DRAFT_1043066 [Russula vinacea]